MPVAQRYKVGVSQDFIEGHVVALSAGGRDLIFIRRLGHVLAFLDECTHQPVKLSEFGEITGGLLMCHAHGGVFDLDQGGAVCAPPPCVGLEAFRCEELAGEVSVFI